MQTTEPAFLAIDGELTIYAVTEWQQALSAKFAACGALDVDLSGVTEIDTAGQQLLVAAKLHALATGKQLRLLGHTQPVLDMLDLCRLGSFFGDPVLLSDLK
jgi:anti-sigma B factor antagonist